MVATDKLAICGGQPTLGELLPRYPSVGDAERQAVCRVIDSGILSGFYGSWGAEFFGGPAVREFERAWSDFFGVRHTVSVNSATSGLIATMGAIGINPGDEVIVPPNTMSATVVAPLFYGGIPVFADIEADSFCLDPDAVRRAFTPRTRAIIAVNQFGHPARLAELRALADERGVALVEDNAQGPLAQEHGRYCGTIAHVGIFSLNYHKHIHTGEGGMCVTDDDALAERLRLIRNHGENVVDVLQIDNIANLVGQNYRMTELSAAIGLAQLARAEDHVGKRERVAHRLSEAVADLEGLTGPQVRSGCRSVYYAWAVRVDERVLGLTRQQFSAALAAEGMPNFVGGVRPLYLLPLFQRRVAFGSSGYPFSLTDRQYAPGLCPIAERIYERELIAFENCMYDIDDRLAERLVHAIRKVHAHRFALVGFNPSPPGSPGGR